MTSVTIPSVSLLDCYSDRMSKRPFKACSSSGDEETGAHQNDAKHRAEANLAGMCFDGKCFFFTRLEGEPARPSLLSFRDLLSPRGQVTDVLLTAMYTEPSWLARELEGLGSANITVALDKGWLGGSKDHKSRRQAAVLAAMPEGEGGRLLVGVWTSAGLMHAKLVLVRFKVSCWLV